VLATYNKNATAISALALGLSIVFLLDSMQGDQKIKRLYIPQIQNALVYPDDQLRLQRLKEIKLSLEVERERQFVTGAMKKLTSSIFSYFMSDATTDSVQSGRSSSAGLMNFYNYPALNTLTKQLKEDHLID
jgi:hypothetical protein